LSDSETHRGLFCWMMGFAPLNPSYALRAALKVLVASPSFSSYWRNLGPGSNAGVLFVSAAMAIVHQWFAAFVAIPCAAGVRRRKV
jgi:hypothetical protein